MSEPSVLQQAADRIWSVWDSGAPCAPVRDLIGTQDLEPAYQVQALNTDRWLAQGRRLSGRKIGLTNPAVRAQIGADQPIHGPLFADQELLSGAQIAPGTVCQPKIEVEVAFVLAQPLEREDLSMAELISAVDFLLPAIEIPGSRVHGWDITAADIAADSGGAGRYVLGQVPRGLDAFDMRTGGMVLSRNGAPVATGAGAATMGSPLTAVHWAATALARRGQPLGPGDVVLSGSLGPVVDAHPGDQFEAEIAGLGSVRVGFAG